ncbi:MAG: TlpA family protein disulfide reductase [Acidimicrobiaceae bacterium]|nr:TlpA family protein disulfide reductase [Acidimicrobiaceae bacterium]
MMFVSIGLGAVLATALIVIVSLLTGGSVNPNGAQATNALVGQSVKGFRLAGLNGGSITAPYGHGHPTVLIFFASWCGPCQAEMPQVAAYLKSHNEGSIRVVGIDTNDSRGNGLGFVTRSRVEFPVAFDPTTSIANGIFKLQAIPDTVFVNAQGIVTQVYQGAIPKEQLAKGLAKLHAA